MKHDPWQINQDPNADNFKVDSLSLPAEVTAQRLVSRHQLTSILERENPMSGRATGFQEQQELAFSLLTSAKVNKAFEIQTESAETRERYGRNKFGQSLLLSRRLVEAGTAFVTLDLSYHTASGTWDTHGDNIPPYGGISKGLGPLLPLFDHLITTLVSDLEERGLLDKVLVIAMGEFGRTPNINPNLGRDHWPNAWSLALAGGGIKTGQVIGSTDERGANVTNRVVSMGDLYATVYKLMGVDHTKEIMSPIGRPIKIVDGGAPVRELFTA